MDMHPVSRLQMTRRESAIFDGKAVDVSSFERWKAQDNDKKRNRTETKAMREATAELKAEVDWLKTHMERDRLYGAVDDVDEMRRALQQAYDDIDSLMKERDALHAENIKLASLPAHAVHGEGTGR